MNAKDLQDIVATRVSQALLKTVDEVAKDVTLNLLTDESLAQLIHKAMLEATSVETLAEDIKNQRLEAKGISTISPMRIYDPLARFE